MLLSIALINTYLLFSPQVNSSVIMGINCPPVWDLEDEGEVFLQRCQVGPVQEYDPTACTGVVRIQCGECGCGIL